MSCLDWFKVVIAKFFGAAAVDHWKLFAGLSAELKCD